MTAPAITETAFRACVTKLLRLHALMIEGRADTPEADALRDEMDPLWYAMTPTERDRIGALSEDLCVLVEGGVQRAVMSPDARAAYGRQWREAYASQDWDRALAMLRQPPSDVPPYAVALLQARLWENLAGPDAAAPFMGQAERVWPEGHSANGTRVPRQPGQAEDKADFASRLMDHPIGAEPHSP
jgi:hypothetical protein